jgi:hypothetical protein
LVSSSNSTPTVTLVADEVRFIADPGDAAASIVSLSLTT